MADTTRVDRRHCHNEQGIRGACPMEMLHALLLGVFKYVCDCLFKQVGNTSQLSDDINVLAQEYGRLLSRQSQRDLPKTTFARGIRKGKLMAKEYPEFCYVWPVLWVLLRVAKC